MSIPNLGNIFKKCKDALVIVSVATLVSATLITDTIANPVISNVAAGKITITQTPTTTTVNQASQKAIINWHSFNIKAGEKTQFIQPNAQAAALNRINPNQGASQIYGQLTANGKIILVNAAGIHFGPGAMVNVGSIIASTTDISDANFMAGKYIFDRPSNMGGSIINEGTIIAANYGLVALIGTNVQNSGYIQAKLGSIALGSGNKFTLDFYGDQLINFTVDEAATQTSTDENGKPITEGVKNTGTLLADGGQILVTAQAAKGVLDRVINMEGVAQAKSVSESNGVIILDGGENGTVEVAGKLDASSDTAKGGTVKVLGNEIKLAANAAVNASGKTGGGEVLIGGNYQGKGAERNAKRTVVEKGAVIKADAVTTGNGGKVIVWADDNTAFHGAISARGGSEGGNGGFVETSAHYLDVKGGTVDTRAAKGSIGTWLLDPTDLIIANTSSSNILQPTSYTYEGDPDQTASVLDVNELINALNNSNITVLTTSGGSGSGLGDITLSANILDTDWTAASTLTLSAYRNINIEANISNSAGGSVVLRADNTGTGTGVVNFNGGAISMTGDNSTVKIYYNPSSFASPTDYAPNVSLTGLNSSLTSYMLINSLGTANDAASAKTLGAVSNNPSLWGENFALGRDIDASTTSSWTNSNGTGFSPIGNSSTAFTGSFDGQNFVIDGLFMNIGSGENGGLFGNIDSSNTINNIGLTNLNVTSDWFAGGLAGEIDGGAIISNVFTTGVIDGNYYSGGIIGFMNANTTLENSYSYVSLAGSTYAAGGLVGSLGVNSVIRSSYFGGSIDTTFGNTGGIAGDAGGSLLNTYSFGSLRNVYGQNGGLVGHLTSAGSITNSYNSGLVYQDPTGNLTNVGGLVGLNDDSSFTNVVDSYWDTDTSGQATSSGGTGLTTNDSLSAGSYNNWDIATDPSSSDIAPGSIWYMTDARTRPMLMMEHSTTVRNAHQVQLMGTTLGADYIIANDIDFTSAMNNLSDIWATNRSTSTGYGFVQIGAYGSNSGIAFMGSIDGQYHLLSNIYLTDTFGSFSFATGFVAVLGQYGQPGGVIQNLGLVNMEVTSTNGSYDVGTMVGSNSGTIERSFATGWIHNVGAYVGGLVGNNNGYIIDSYADVYVQNNSGSGVLVGLNGASDQIVNSFGLGYASGSGFGDFDFVDGINSFWNIDRAGTSYNGGNIQGKTNAQLMQQATYTGYDFTNTWAIIEGQSFAYLKGFYPTPPQIISGTSGVAGGNQVNIAINGVVTDYRSYTGADTVSDGSTTTPSAAPGFYYIMLPSGTISNGSYILSYLTGSTKGNAISVTDSSGSPGLNITANAISAGDNNSHAFSSADFATAAGSLKATLPTNILYTVTGSDINLDTNIGFATTANTSYTMDGNISGSTPGQIDGPISILGTLYLTQDTTLYTPTGDIALGDVSSNSPANAYNFTLTTDTGIITLNGTIGIGDEVGNFDANASNTIINGGGVIAMGNINIGDIELGTTTNTQLTSNTGEINVGGITGTGSNTLAITAATNINLNDDINFADGSLRLSAQNFAGSSIGTNNSFLNVNIVVNNLFLDQGWIVYDSLSPLPTLTVNNNFSIGLGSDYNNMFNAEFDRYRDNGGILEIYDIYGLQGIATGNTSGNYVLMNDIDASGTANWSHNNGDTGFIPIAGNLTAAAFSGTFDGNYHIIDSLYINSSQSAVGLFGTLSGSTISNIGLTNISVSTTITGVSLTGYAFAGGLAGYSADSFGSGGPVPNNISNVFVTGQVNLTSNTSLTQTGVGGLIGNLDQMGGTNTTNLTDAYSTANVSLNDLFVGSTTIHNVGGLIGLLGGNVTNTYSAGAVSATTDPSFAGTVNIGGLVGNIGNIFGFPTNASVNNSYFDTETSGQTLSAGGTGKTTAEMKQEATFVGFDFSTTPVWGIVENVITPYLYGFYGTNPPIPTLISGIVQGGAAGLTLQLISGGTVLGSATTNSSGAYTFSINSTFTNGQPILVYVSGSSFIGNLVTYATGTTQTLSAILADTLSIDNDFESISNTYLSTLKGGLTNANILYGVTGTDLTLGNGTYNNINFVTSAATNYNVDGNISGTAGGTVNMTFNGSVNLVADAAITADAGSIVFNSTIDGAQQLTTGSGGGVTFNGNVGDNTALTSLTVNNYNGATDTIAAGITTDQTQDYGNAIVLADTNGSSINLTSWGSSITFRSSIDNEATSAAIDLNIYAGAGSNFYGNIGADQALNSITLENTGIVDSFNINTSNGYINSITTLGNQTYNNYFIMAYGSGPSASAIVHFIGNDINFNNVMETNQYADVTINTTGSNSAIYSIGDIHSLTKTGNGTLVIGYNGSTTGMSTYVNDGMLIMTNDYALGAQDGSNARLVVNSGAIAALYYSNLDISGTGDTVILNDGSALQTNGAYTIYGGHIALDGNVTFDIINGGELTLSTGIDSLSSVSPANLTTTGDGSIVFNNNVGVNSALTSLTFNNIVTTNASDIITTGDQTYNQLLVTGSTTFNGNTLSFNDITILNNQIFRLEMNSGVINGDITSATTAIMRQLSGDLELNGTINSGGLLTYGLSGGSLTVNNGNAFADIQQLTMENNSILKLNNVDLDFGNAGFVYFDGTIQTTGTSSISSNFSMDASFATAMNFDVTGDLTFNFPIISSGVLNLVKEGSGTLNLVGNNQLSGVTINNGSVSVADGSSLGVAGTIIDVNNNANLRLDAASLSDFILNLNGGSVSSSGVSSISNTAILLTANTNISADAGSVLTVNSDIDGAFDLGLSGLGAINFNSNLGSVASLNSVTSSVANLGLGGNVTTTGGQTYTGILTLNSNATLTTNTGALVLTGGINGSGRNLNLVGGSNNAFTLAGTLNANNITITGGSGTNSLTVNSGRPQIWAISGANSGGISGITEVTGSLFFTQIQNLIGGNSAANTFSLNGGTLYGSITGGTSGNNRMIGDNTANTWNITGTNAGSVTGLTGGFTQIQNLTGGNQADTYYFNDSSSLSGEIDGGSLAGGQNTLNYASVTAPVNILLTADYVGYSQNITNNIIHTFVNIHSLVGDATSNSTLTVLTPSKANLITITGNGSGFVNDPVNFTGFRNFMGAGSNNTVYVNGPYTYTPGTGTITAFGNTYTVNNIQTVTGSVPPQPTPNPEPAPNNNSSSGTTTTSSSSSSSSSANSTTVQVVTSATINSHSESETAYQTQNDENTYDSASGTFITSSPVVIVVNTSINNMVTQQQALDLLIGESQSFGSCK